MTSAFTGGKGFLLEDDEFFAIEKTLLESERGRAFLADYLIRNRSKETLALLSSVQRLETAILGTPAPTKFDSIRNGIFDMQEAIERTKREITRMTGNGDDANRFIAASNELDAIVSSTEKATQGILAATEVIQEKADVIRSAGVADGPAAAIEDQSMEIFMACSFQDLTGQRIQKVVSVLQYLEERIDKMVTIWEEAGSVEGLLEEEAPEEPRDKRPDAHLLNGPQLDGEGVDQADIDALFEGTGTASDLEMSGAPIPLDSIRQPAH
ncbi:hypothetical protein E1162_18485 [Rhodobacteraceae bacterium RKSG542]|uniref:protein phosphatase CheZ n=1 Tax=Pseudovibrio flavus TaxID=2529854 RepID=UPI0012BBF14C|nr:protein phosphatase CheZ [Pseudovibrio flavus]MTI19233.1 hypothetical protein [Pseudovibrio flavus]